MESFLSRYKNGLVLLVVLLAQLIGLALQVRRPLPNQPDGPPVRLLRYWMVSLITPPARVSHGAGRGVRGIWSNYIDLWHVRQQNLDLKAELDRLRLEQGAIAEDARQGQRLEHLLDFKEHYIYKTATAQVIGTAGSDRSRLLIIDKGSRDGIALDMPVITPDGIVGKIREVFPHTAQVLEISDQSSGAGVILETTRIRGVLRGNAFGQPQIINILPDDRIKPGERVITSGGDQIYPRGLPVGVVDRVANDPERNPYVDVIVQPSANLSRLEEVLVITSTGDQVPATEDSDLAESEADAKQHSAAEVLSEKLPSIRDPNAPAADGAATAPGTAATGAAGAGTTPPEKADGPAPPPPKPPPPLHPDRFTPGASPAAVVSVPGVGPSAADSPTGVETPPSDEKPVPTPTRKAPAAVSPAKSLASKSVAHPKAALQPTPRAGSGPNASHTELSAQSKAAASPATTTSTGSKAKSPPSSTTDSGSANPASGTPKYVEPYFVKPQAQPGAKPAAKPAHKAQPAPNTPTQPPQGAA
jgi:rod shape-determining protein MreC